METTVESVYTVALCDYPGLPDRERVAAEVRYCKALERRLGSADGVAQTLREVAAQADDETGDTDEARTLALRWRLANTAARQLGLQGLGDLPSAYFHVALG